MSKELIISVNGREKKIAILDNGKVTEFYIERGEENSGVVGNIYKGRVMRVLPGMQSAFVDIGLERDAFLYVSDFFDEEEEIERIVMEKSKKGSPEEISREAVDKIERARLEREKQMEAAQEIAEPLVESGMISDVEEPIEEAEEVQARDQGKKSRRGKKPKRDRAPERSEAEARTQAADEAVEVEEDEDLVSFDETDRDEIESEPIFEIGDTGFERVIDDEDMGEMFKDAYMQEAIVDKVRAIEFDMEGTSSAEVGSLIDSVTSYPNGFQRVGDDEDAESAGAAAQAAETKKSKSRRGGKGRKKDAEGSARETRPVEAPPPDVAEEAAAEETQAEKKEDNKTSARGRKGRSAKAKSDDAETAPVEAPPSAETADEKDQSKAKSGRSKKSSGKGRKSAKDGELEDAEASVKESPDTAKMAARRGGRGGRSRRGGRGGKPPKTQERFDGSAETEDAISGEGETAAASADGAEKSYAGGNGRSSGRRERSQPTITDLLREGQEILVQIAKEPIARKGARITSHIALPGRYLVYMPTIEHLGVSRKIESANERGRLRTMIQKIRQEESIPSGGFIVRTAGVGVPEQNLREDARYLVRTWLDVKKTAEKSKSPALVHQDLDIIQRILRDQLSDEFTAIRVDSEEEYLRIVEFVNRIQPRMVSRVKLYTRDEPILETYGVQEEIDKALKPRVWLKSGGYLVINQTEALVAIDVNTGKFVGKGNARLEDTITKTNMEAVEEIARQIRLRDLGGIIVLDLIDMEDRRNRQKVLQALQESLSTDKSPTKVLSFNDFGLIIMTRKRVKQSLERTLCSPCEYCEGAGWVKSPQTVCYEILEESRRLSRTMDDVRQTTLRVHPDVSTALRGTEREVLEEIEAYLGPVDLTSDPVIHQEQFDFAFI